MIKKINKGFALIEVLIAVTIISGSMLTVVSVANKSVTYAQNSLKDYQATLAMEETIEAVKSIRAANWSNISSLTDGQNYGLDFVNNNYTTIQNPTEDTLGFTKSFSVNNVMRDANNDIAVSGTLDSGTKKIIINISWVDGGKNKSKNIQFYIANIL